MSLIKKLLRVEEYYNAVVIYDFSPNMYTRKHEGKWKRTHIVKKKRGESEECY